MPPKRVSILLGALVARANAQLGCAIGHMLTRNQQTHTTFQGNKKKGGKADDEDDWESALNEMKKDEVSTLHDG